MANKVVNLVINLKDGVSSKLQGMKQRLAGIGAGMKKVAIAGVAMAGAVSAAMIQMAKTFAQQQDAEVALASALDQVGLAGSKLLPIFQEYATSIQRVTKYGDEAILASMAYGKNLGINTGQLKEATTAAIGLASKYKIDLQTAMMLVGRASQGQTQMLTRYGIVLDETLSPQEKFNEVLKIGADAFSLAEAETKSLSGAYTQLKNALGDAQETIIAAMTDGKDFAGVMNGLTESIAKLIDEGDISFWATEISDAFNSIKTTMAPVVKLFDMLKSGVRAGGGYIGGFWGEVMNGGGVGSILSGKAIKSGMEGAFSANDDYRARKRSFKQSFQEERIEKKRLAEEQSMVEKAAVVDKVEVEKEAKKSLVEEIGQLEEDVAVAAGEAGAESFIDSLEESLASVPEIQAIEAIAAPSSSGGSGGGGISGLGGATDLFSALTGRGIEGGGGRTTTQALEEIKELLHGSPEDMAAALKTAISDLQPLRTTDEGIYGVLEKQYTLLTDIYKLQSNRLGGVLN